ncbi:MULTISPECIES: glycosyltransferase family 4 protein [unclassified Roseofilum]|uniref:glycosyltransferase family 4 protein n=1 Tax=unclassified Roseofilum TaxID=2620099 RepID=UPI00298EACDA|nr:MULTISPECIES: glycosyltransferase family 4 protein [unclassified Roseofilum]
MMIHDLEKKRILVVSSVYPLTADGNHGAFIREVILKLQPTGANFYVFAPAYEGCPHYTLDNVLVYRFRYCPKPLENLVRDGAPTKIQRQPWYLIPAALYILLGTVQLFGLCWKLKPDLLHINWPFPHGLMAFPVAKLLGIPMVFSFHGGELLLAKKFGFVARILRQLIPESQGVTANSSFTQALIGNLSSEPVTVIPYGITITPQLESEIPANPIPQLLFVGRLDERKGVTYLLQALPLILRDRRVQLHIVGQGILESELKEECKALGLEAQVKFLGVLSKEALAQEYATCDIFVLPAIVDRKGDTEGLGIVMIEALAHGKPVVASDVGGIKDVIIDGVTGRLVPEKDPHQLAEVITDLLNCPEERQRLGCQGLKHIQTQFNWSRITHQWSQVFAQALSNSNSSEIIADDSLIF